MLKKLAAVASTALIGTVVAGQAFAATATGSLNVKLTIIAECKVISATDLDFGTDGVLDANIDQTSTITVQCTNNTPYVVGLGVGSGAGATVASRKMTGPASATVNYTIYRDAGRTQLWGVTSGTDTVGQTGNGATQALTAYGRVAPQTTPGAGAYTDVVAVTVTY